MNALVRFLIVPMLAFPVHNSLFFLKLILIFYIYTRI